MGEVPFKGNHFLVAQKEYNDYYLYLTSTGAQQALTRHRPFGLPSSSYEPLDTFVNSDESGLEEIQLRATRDSQDLWDGFSYQDIVFIRDRKGPVVLVKTWLLAGLANGDLPYLTTRYDGHTNKN